MSWLIKRNGMYYVGWRANGKDRYKALGTESLAVAQKKQRLFYKPRKSRRDIDTKMFLKAREEAGPRGESIPKQAPFSAQERRDVIAYLTKNIGLRCWHCGFPLVDESVHIDHIVPRSYGGASHLDNYALSCRFCNLAKSKFTLKEFYCWIDYIGNSPFKRFLETSRPKVTSKIVSETDTEHGQMAE